MILREFQKPISNEAQRALNELDNKITKEQTDRIDAVAAETNTRIEEDNEIKAALTAETNARVAQDGEIRKDIGAITMPRDPEYITVDGKKHLFANGTPITINEDPNTHKITATWYGVNSVAKGKVTDTLVLNEQEIDPNAIVFGGGYGRIDNERNKGVYFTNSQITINGGTLERVYGGCYGSGAVGVATIVVNGGTISKGLHGGGQKGSAALFHSNSVGYANITINAGTFGSVVTAGGVDGVNVGEAVMTINGGSIQWLVASGSNGNINKSKVIVNGGRVYRDALSVNRGAVENVEWIINGGIINKLWTGADIDDGDFGTIGHCSMKIKGGTIDELHLGRSNNILMDASSTVSGTYIPGHITNDEAASAQACNLTIDPIYNNFTSQGATLTEHTNTIIQHTAAINQNAGAIGQEVTDRTNADNVLSGRITNIENRLPGSNSEGELADKQYVNNQVNSMTAHYICRNANGEPFETKAQFNQALASNPKQLFSAGALRVPTHNDYTIILRDESDVVPASQKLTGGIAPTTRYIYQVNSTTGEGSWQLQYVVNNTGFSDAQLAALNSGINYSDWEAAKSDIAKAKADITKAETDISNLESYIDGKLITKRITLKKEDWNNAAQIATVTGISNVENKQLIFINPTSSSYAKFIEYEIQGEQTGNTDQIRFTYDSNLTIPSVDIDVYVSILDMKTAN